MCVLLLSIVSCDFSHWLREASRRRRKKTGFPGHFCAWLGSPGLLSLEWRRGKPCTSERREQPATRKSFQLKQTLLSVSCSLLVTDDARGPDADVFLTREASMGFAAERAGRHVCWRFRFYLCDGRGGRTLLGVAIAATGIARSRARSGPRLIRSAPRIRRLQYGETTSLVRGCPRRRPSTSESSATSRALLPGNP